MPALRFVPGVMPGPQIPEAIRLRRPRRFVIASLLLEVRASEGSEIDGRDGRSGAENRVGLVTRRGSQSICYR